MISLPTAILASGLALVQGGQVPIQYDLRVGDRLVYREVLDEYNDNRSSYALSSPVERQSQQQWEWEVRAEWDVQLVVLWAERGNFAIGAQRNRRDVELSRYSLAGEDVLSSRGPTLLERLRARGSARYAHGMRISSNGAEQVPGEILREWSSKALWMLTEFPPLPDSVVVGITQWRNGLLDIVYEAQAWETLDGVTCLRIEGTSSESLFLDRPEWLPDTVVHRIWFCPSLGLVKRMEFDGSYPGAIFQKTHQRIRWELVDRRRGESAESWLENEDAREGVVAGLALADEIPFSLDRVYSLLGTGSSDMDRRVLGLTFRAGWRAPSAEALQRASESGDARSSVLARRLADGTPPSPVESPMCVGPGGPGSEPYVPARGWERTGTSLRVMGSGDFDGWPYGVRVPEDYRGDESFPLVFYLAGNNGPMLEGIAIASLEMSGTGYLVVYPQAVDAWWDPRSTQMFDALYREVMKRFNVDPDRVYITGLSNGGTGTYFYASFWPQRFSAAVSAMGAGQLGPHVLGAQAPHPSHLRNLPMLFLHGQRDRTIPPLTTLATLEALVPRIAPLESRIFPDRAHEITPGAGDDGLTIEFLDRFRSRPNPRSVRISAGVLDFPRQYWVEILSKEGGEDHIATVDAELHEDGSIAVETQNVRRLRLLLSPRLMGSATQVRVEVNGQSVYEGPVVHDCALFQQTFRETGDLYSAYSQVLEFDVPG